MGEAQDCPRCGLVNPPEARRCDCGYDFAARRFVGPLLPPAGSGALGRGSAVLLGLLLGSAGALVGAGVGIPVRVWSAGPGPDGCGLWTLPVILEGAIRGALLGGLIGALAAVVIARRRSPA